MIKQTLKYRVPNGFTFDFRSGFMVEAKLMPACTPDSSPADWKAWNMKAAA
ncbi:hypothetical protein D3C87_1896330 [compost metagenome]